MRAWLIKVREAAAGAIDLRDVFVFGGLGCAVYGIAQVHSPAAWIVGGAALFWLGIKKP